MQQIIKIIIIILSLALYSQGASAADTIKKSDEGSLRQVCITDQTSPDAILTNGHNSYRFGSSRPQRIIPVHGSKNSKTQGKIHFTIKHQQHLNHHFSGRHQRASLPFRPSLSSDYYVIALRHIVR
ncbi:MAG: hypothetical protein IJV13_00485 [Prevotella sp.]|nr:hypothetical protein [Prevotella sp.]